MDKLKITVFDVDNLSGIYQVDYAGFVNLPLIEDVKAIGLTSSELAAQLETRYGAKMLQDPDITVSIEESLGRRVTVDGSVSKPGIFPILGEVTLIQAIALAGGPSENANPKKVVVFRTIDAERRAAAFDLTAIRNGTAEDPAIYGNDVIVVDGSEARRTYGEVLRSIPLFALFLAF